MRAIRPEASNPWDVHFRRLLAFSLTLLLSGGTLRADDTTRQAQEELRKRNLYFGDINGRATPDFCAALAAYQQRKGFTPTGTLNDETLVSFGLRAPETFPAAWPDVPVLKSDSALLSTLIPPPPVPLALPAPAGQPGPDQDLARLFVERYLLASQANDPPAEAQFYAARCEYFKAGLVDRAFVERDIARYNAGWPNRYFALDGPVRVSPGDRRGRVVVKAVYRFNVMARKYSVHGKIESTYTLEGDQPEDWRIVRITEKRISR